MHLTGHLLSAYKFPLLNIVFENVKDFYAAYWTEEDKKGNNVWPFLGRKGPSGNRMRFNFLPFVVVKIFSLLLSSFCGGKKTISC